MRLPLNNIDKEQLRKIVYLLRATLQISLCGLTVWLFYFINRYYIIRFSLNLGYIFLLSGIHWNQYIMIYFCLIYHPKICYLPFIFKPLMIYHFTYITCVILTKPFVEEFLSSFCIFHKSHIKNCRLK